MATTWVIDVNEECAALNRLRERSGWRPIDDEFTRKWLEDRNNDDWRRYIRNDRIQRPRDERSGRLKFQRDINDAMREYRERQGRSGA